MQSLHGVSARSDDQEGDIVEVICDSVGANDSVSVSGKELFPDDSLCIKHK